MKDTVIKYYTLGHRCFKVSVTLIFFCALLLCTACGPENVENAIAVNRQPSIFPDYIDVCVPANIAPLNFCSTDSAVMMTDVVFRDESGETLHYQTVGAIDIPVDDWHKLLAANTGKDITVEVSTRNTDGRWHSYDPFSIHVSADSIDYGLAYRLVSPGYEKYSQMGIYQRNLSNFDERAIIDNTNVEGCVNCHSFNRCDPKDMSMHVRGPHGATMLRTDGGEPQVYNTATPTTSACVYPYWHPSGKYVAYSTNTTMQAIHSTPDKVLEVFDTDSDVHVYDVDNNRLLLCPTLHRDSVMNTFPAFSPDGKWLYYCTARFAGLDSIKDIRYDILRVAFDPANGKVGTEADTVVSASGTGKSAVLPRPSFDGKHLVYTLCDYGTFPIWHHEADLWIVDLATGETRSMDAVNSSDTESYHNFSSNSRWLVFGSRRIDGRFTRAYIAHVDAQGNASKPFLLPQRDPKTYYDDQYRSYNIPEFITRPVDIDRVYLEELLLDTQRINFQADK